MNIRTVHQCPTNVTENYLSPARMFNNSILPEGLNINNSNAMSVDCGKTPWLLDKLVSANIFLPFLHLQETGVIRGIYFFIVFIME
ncbi:hypothetical protein CEXT_726621 [Caerostris extrusa]|uniref:Uncharacterized protein n=1 Tax=Caerostris extrusa TaxID=172846 RepID=A0AAV4XDN1_CAEEX|nr:hypothetical protein CEXT_726621 [Caerostris extrusa]